MVAPWRDAGSGPTFQFCADGHDHSACEEDPRAQVSCDISGFLPRCAFSHHEGRDFNESDVQIKDRVPTSANSAQRMFPNKDPINRHVSGRIRVLKPTATGPP